jgi:formate dehydrogenase major subunit
MRLLRNATATPECSYCFPAYCVQVVKDERSINNVSLLRYRVRFLPSGPAVSNTVNKGRLCSKGHFGFDFIHHGDRLKTPLIRRDGRLVPCSWEEAYDCITSRLSEIIRQSGPDAVAGFSSARCTNEENYLMQKFMRAAVGTNNVDHCARL